MDLFTERLDRLLQVLGAAPFRVEHLLYLSAITAAMLGIDLLASGWQRSALARLWGPDPSARNDLWAWGIEAFGLFNLIGLVLSLGLCYYLAGVVQRHVHLDLTLPHPHLQFVLVYLAADLKNYFRHYVFHRSSTLWELHAFHHSATSFTLLTRQRGHFMETEISRFFDILPFALLGAPAQSYFALVALNEAHQLLLHSGSTSTWGCVGKYILVSPAAHTLHHSIEERHHDRNYGSTFIFWDRLFGTYHAPEPVAAIGIRNNPFNRKGYVHDILLAQRRFLAHLIGRKRANPPGPPVYRDGAVAGTDQPPV